MTDIKLSEDVMEALEIVWKDYFPEDMASEDAIDNFKMELVDHLVGATLCDIFRQKLLDDEVITIEEQISYSVLFKEENKYPLFSLSPKSFCKSD